MFNLHEIMIERGKFQEISKMGIIDEIPKIQICMGGGGREA